MMCSCFVTFILNYSQIQGNEEDNYLGDVIKHLELEEKFSTVNRPQGTQKKGKESNNFIFQSSHHPSSVLLTWIWLG